MPLPDDHFSNRELPLCVDLDNTLLQARSEEHTSELQSPCNLVCRLLLEKKKLHVIDRLDGQSEVVQLVDRVLVELMRPDVLEGVKRRRGREVCVAIEAGLAAHPADALVV